MQLKRHTSVVSGVALSATSPADERDTITSTIVGSAASRSVCRRLSATTLVEFQRRLLVFLGFGA
ncbi:MAG: hypothetical protein ACOYBY_07360 [Dermatophilaceae bacterium]